MVNPIVQINGSVTVAPGPDTLQRSGAIVTQGGTNTTPGTLSLLTQTSDLTPLTPAPIAISSLAWSGNVVTVTTSTPHGWTNADIIPIVIAGAVPVGYNGSFTGTVTGASTLTYPLGVNPGAESTPGTVTLGAVGELATQVDTFFSQNLGIGVYVLELGEAEVTPGVATLGTWIQDNPGVLYSYEVPREWDSNSAFLAFLGGFNAFTSKTYFIVTTTVENYTNYTALMKCVFLLVEAPGIPSTEFSASAPFQVMLNKNPSGSNQLTQLAYAFLFDVTPYPTSGNAALLTALKNASVNIVGIGSEGGISNAILLYGKLKSGVPFNFWYSVDWAQINLDEDLANAVINGSNNPVNPLQYNQAGINVLQGVGADTLSSGVTAGVLTGDVIQTELTPAQFQANFNAGLYNGMNVINADPWQDYVTNNPGNFTQGIYGGFIGVITPAGGFETIIFNLNAVEL